VRQSRLLALTILLINRRRIAAPEIAQRFGVTVRTVYRDIEALRSAGIPVTGCQGIDGGFALMENYRLTRQLLTFEDIVSILSTLTGINHTLRNPDLDNIIEKIGCMIPQDREDEFNRVSELIAFDMTPWSPGDQHNLLDITYAAAAARKLIEFVYRDYSSTLTHRIIEPMTLVFKAGMWYLFGYCRLRSDYRLFRLSRMEKITVSDKRFNRRGTTFRETLETRQHNRNPVTLRLLFSPRSRMNIDDFIRPQHSLQRADGFIEATLTVENDEWVCQWLLGFGKEVEVLAPQSIRDALRNQLQILQTMYNR